MDYGLVKRIRDLAKNKYKILKHMNKSMVIIISIFFGGKSLIYCYESVIHYYESVIHYKESVIHYKESAMYYI